MFFLTPVSRFSLRLRHTLTWTLPLILGCTTSIAIQPRLQGAEPPPRQLQELITNLDKLGNQHNQEKIQTVISPTFTTADGIDYPNFEKALQSLWQRYPNISYQTTVKSWEQVGQQWIAQTQTNIEANSQWQGRPALLKSVVESKQTFEGGKLIYQQILSERVTLTSGDKPPLVDVRLPNQVKPGQTFDFDIILQEPNDDNLLAGVAFSQDITANNYLKPTKITLELLQAGGLFKRAQAPKKEEPQWLSALLVSPNGMTWITQRLRVEK